MLDDFLPPAAKTGEDLNTNSYVLLYKSCTSKRDEMRMVLLEPMNHIRCVEACEDLNVFWEEKTEVSHFEGPNSTPWQNDSQDMSRLGPRLYILRNFCGTCSKKGDYIIGPNC